MATENKFNVYDFLSGTAFDDRKTVKSEGSNPVAKLPETAETPSYSTDLQKLLHKKAELTKSLSRVNRIYAGTDAGPLGSSGRSGEYNRIFDQLQGVKNDIVSLTGDSSAAKMTLGEWNKLFLDDKGNLIERTRQYPTDGGGTVTVDAMGQMVSGVPYDEEMVLQESYGEKTIKAMGQPRVWEHMEAGRLRIQRTQAEKLEQQLKIDQLRMATDPGYVERKKKEVELQAFVNRRKREESPSAFSAFLEDLGSGVKKFSEEGVSTALMALQGVGEAVGFGERDPQVLEALEDIKEGRLRIYGTVRSEKEIAERFHDPEGWGAKIGMVAPAAALSVAGMGTKLGLTAVLSTFGLMGLGQGMSEYDRIVKETGMKPEDSDRLLMGIGYGVAEAGAEFVGIGFAKLGAAMIGKRAARELGEKAVSNGLMAAVKKYGSKYGIAAIATGSAVEGGEEVLTTIAHNLIANQYDPRNEWYQDWNKGTLDAFVLGAIGGGMIVGPAIAVKGLGGIVQERQVASIERQVGAQVREAAETEGQAVEEQPTEAAQEAAEALGEVREDTEVAEPQEAVEDAQEAPVEPAETVPIPSGRIVITKDGVPVEEAPGEGPRSWEFGGDTVEQSDELLDRAIDDAETEVEKLGEGFSYELYEDVEDGPRMSPAEPSPYPDPPSSIEAESLGVTQALERQSRKRNETTISDLRKRAEETTDAEKKGDLLREADLLEESLDTKQAPKGVRVLPRQQETRTPLYNRLRLFAKRNGLRIRQVDTRGSVPFEGLYHKGTIYVDASRVRKSQGETEKQAWTSAVFARILSHELVHGAKDVSPRVYEFLKNNISDRQLGKAFIAYQRRLGRSGVGRMQQLSPSLQMEEAIADAVPEMLKKIGAGRYFGDQSMLSDFVDFVRSIAARYGLRGKFAKSLDSVVRQMAEGKTFAEMTLPGTEGTQATARPSTELALSPAENEVEAQQKYILDLLKFSQGLWKDFDSAPELLPIDPNALFEITSLAEPDLRGLIDHFENYERGGLEVFYDTTGNVEKTSLAYYGVNTHRIVITNRSTPMTVLHELVHAYTSRQLQTELPNLRADKFNKLNVGIAYIDEVKKALENPSLNPNARSLINAYLQVADEIGYMDVLTTTANQEQATLRNNLPYGMTNLDEFVAEAISNNSFQEILEQIEYKGDQVILGESVRLPVRPSILSKIIEAIRNLLKIRPQTAAESVLNEVLSATVGIMDAQSSAVKDRTYEAHLQRIKDRQESKPTARMSPAETETRLSERQKDWIRVLDMHGAAEDSIKQLWYDDLDLAALMFNEEFFDEVKASLPQKDGYFYPDMIELENDSTARERVPEELTAEDVIPVREHYRNLTYQWLLETKGPGPYRLYRGDVKGMHRGLDMEDMPLGVFTTSELYTAQDFASQDKPSAKDKSVEQYDEVQPEDVLYAVEAFDKPGAYDESNYLVLAESLVPSRTILGRVRKNENEWMPVWSPAEDLTPEEQKIVEEEALQDIAGDDLVAQGAILIVRDNLSDYGLWHDAMKLRYQDANFDFEAEASELWRDANVLADYMLDESETGYSARKAADLKTKSEQENYSGLRRQVQMQKKAAAAAEKETRQEQKEAAKKRAAKVEKKTEARAESVERRTQAANYRALKHKLRAESAAARQGMVLGRQIGIEKGLAKGAERLERFKMKIEKEKADLKELKQDFRKILKTMGYSSKKLRDKLPTAALREDFTTRKRMIQVVEEVAAIVEELRRKHAQDMLRKVLKNLDIKKMRPEYAEPISAILDRAKIGFKEYAPGEDKKLRALQEYIADDRTREDDIPNSLVQKMSLLRDRKISDLSTEDAQEIRESILHLKNQNDLKNKLIGRGKRRDYLRSRNEIMKDLDTTFKDANRDSAGRKITKHRWALTQIWSKFSMLTLDRMAMYMGNASRNSEAYRRLYEDLADGQTEMLRDFQSDKDYLIREMEAAGIDVTLENLAQMSEPHAREKGRLKAMIEGDLTGKTRKDAADVQYMDITLQSRTVLKVTPGERIALLMHLRDLSTREQFTRRKRKAGIYIPRMNKTYMLTKQDVNNIEDMSGDAREKENAIASIMLARINGSIRQRMSEYSLELNGYDITRDQTYMPRRRQGTNEAKFDDTSWSEIEHYGIDHVGITKSRSGSDLPIILGDAFVEFNNHSYTVSGLKNMSAPMRNIRKLLSNNEMKTFLDSKDRGKDIQAYFRLLLADLATDISGGASKGAIVDKASTRFARRFTVGALGANPRVMLYQVASLAAASSDMPPQYIGPAMRNALGPEGAAITEEMRLRSPYLRERFDSDAYGLVSEGLGRTQGTLVERKKLTDKMMGGIAKFDEMAIRTIWQASKDWVALDIRTGKLEGVAMDSKAYWNEVNKRAEATVKRTQPTMDILHITPLSRAGRRGSGASRLISMFASQRHKNVNMMWEVYMDLKSGRKKQAARALAFHTVMQPMILWSMRGLYALVFGEAASFFWEQWKGPSPEEEEDDYWTLASMIDSVASSVLGNLPLGDLPGYAIRKTLSATMKDYPNVREPSISPVVSSAIDLTTLTANVASALASEEQELSEGQIYTLIRTMTTASGIPLSPAYDAWRSSMGRTTYAELARKRYSELNRKHTAGDLTKEEASERKKMQRAFRMNGGVPGISSLMTEAKKAKDSGNMKKHDRLMDRAEGKARRLYGG